MMQWVKPKIILLVDLALTFAAFAAVLLIGVVILEFADTLFPELLLDAIFAFLALTACSLYLLKRYPADLVRPSQTKSNLKTAVNYGVLGGLLMTLLSFPYSYLFSDGMIIREAVFQDKNILYTGLFYFLAILLQPFIEEVFFRGCLYRVIKQELGFLFAILSSSVLFASGHKISSEDQFLRMLLISFLLTFVYEYSGNIISPVISHIIGNATWYGAVFLKDGGIL